MGKKIAKTPRCSEENGCGKKMYQSSGRMKPGRRIKCPYCGYVNKVTIKGNGIVKIT